MNYNDIALLVASGEKIFNIPLRVCYYCRVSTDSDVQLNSLDNQRDYYENYIKSKEKWLFIDGYIEEGVSGVRVDKRDSFKKMIKDAKQGKFDLIITKEASRFARDLEDSIHYIRILKEANVGVFFENQNLCTFDRNSDMILNILFNIAQDESMKISTRVKFGHHQSMLKGRVLGSSNIIGYKKDNCKLIILPDEARLIKLIFELYSTGQYGFCKLGKELANRGYRNKNNHIYDKDTLKRIIENPKYKGYYRAGMYEVIDYRTKKRQKNSISNQKIWKCDDGSVPPIVSEELWDSANLVLSSRTNKYITNCYKVGGVKYPFSSKIICSNDNCHYQRSILKSGKNIWRCSIYSRYGIKECYSPVIYENDLYMIMELIIKCFNVDWLEIVIELSKKYDSVCKNNNNQLIIKDIRNKINKLESQKSFIFELAYDKKIDIAMLKFKLDELNDEIELLTKKKNTYINNLWDNTNHSILDEINDDIINDAVCDLIRLVLKKIVVKSRQNDRKNIELDIYLFSCGLGKDKMTFDYKGHQNHYYHCHVYFNDY